ncbi:MAG TPA: uracil-DNA glycosylase [bacterium]|nr:uracil-DNA glycosylase [bacterium]HOL47683.1 uracil-DNA glycosylase [bacterium]HPQ18707.1 uracil-DNA glycosylase [bacterium]
MYDKNYLLEIISQTKRILKNNYNKDDLIYINFFEKEENKKEVKKSEIKIITGEENEEKEKKEKLIKELREKYKKCKNCILSKTRKNVVFDKGSAESKIMIITSPPDEIEDENGIIFSGEDKELFNNMMKAIGLDANKLYITSIVKCHSKEHKLLTEKEIFECMKILEEQIEIIKPKYILIFGNTAAQYFLKKYKTGITQLRGIIEKRNDYYVMATLHPKAIMKKPSEKRLVWEDLKKFRDLINGKLSE